MAVVFRPAGAPVADRIDSWQQLLHDTVGPLEPDGVPDEVRAGALGAVRVAELSQTAPGGAVRTARHVGDPGLMPRMVAAAHYVSVRYLHKLFETEQTTVAQLIRHRRLERCRRDLLDPAFRAVPVSAIAARWGLLNAAHLSRAFRTAYGAAPIEYRRLTQPPG
jgi:AraC-like DNA-binding protein